MDVIYGGELNTGICVRQVSVRGNNLDNGSTPHVQSIPDLACYVHGAWRMAIWVRSGKKSRLEDFGAVWRADRIVV